MSLRFGALITEFEATGLRQVDFCNKHGLALSTLQRGLKWRRTEAGEQGECDRLIEDPRSKVIFADRIGLLEVNKTWAPIFTEGAMLLISPNRTDIVLGTSGGLAVQRLGKGKSR